ncbi:hypothetical protein [uncultured Duncaniella sp.]|uniref:hypothetical protein n=1 Tax=uncultured Duncaniella sp. TaxID=2768039 RepID=UPI0026E99526|nr:hypothetical protein [uncultured Duncaniella sp.]
MSFPQNKKDSAIAATVTFFVVLTILLVLFFTGISYNAPQQLAQDSTPELMVEEETFLEPEILKDLGEENAVNNDAPAKAFQGEPDPDPKENVKIVEPGKNSKPAPPTPKLVSTKKESPVKTTEPSATEEERKRVTSAMAKGFVGRNGNTQGSSGSDGAGENGIGIVGNASGRTFKGCPKPDVTLRHKTTVKVSVVIDSEGKVISASASGAASASIRSACERAARQARWSEKKGTGETRGTLTFTITPR